MKLLSLIFTLAVTTNIFAQNKPKVGFDPIQTYEVQRSFKCMDTTDDIVLTAFETVLVKEIEGSYLDLHLKSKSEVFLRLLPKQYEVVTIFEGDLYYIKLEDRELACIQWSKVKPHPSLSRHN